MCKKSSFPVIFNVFLAFFITLTVTIFNLAVQHTLTPLNLLVNMVYGFCLNMVLETLIDLPGFGNKFLKIFHLKFESVLGYFVRTFFIVALLVILMSIILMFCEFGYMLPPVVFLGTRITKLPAIFLVAYVTALIVIAPCMKLTGVICSKEG